jgi:hypothetical protein
LHLFKTKQQIMGFPRIPSKSLPPYSIVKELPLRTLVTATLYNSCEHPWKNMSAWGSQTAFMLLTAPPDQYLLLRRYARPVVAS